ncbi:MAG: hypothetical protein IMF03_03135 [Proteobacteria bacterium]|nr:hypothetical protein [Pseudomonadota bacterium]
MKTTTKQLWSTPRLTVFGSIEKITKDIPPKQFGGSDGAVYQSQNVGWGS